jgi:competence protein ComEC
VLDVGQGLSVVVQTATHTLLYDAGSKYNEQSDAGARIVVPFLQGEGVNKLDGFMVSHNDIDHSGGMTSVLAQIPLGWLASSLPDELELSTSAKRMKCYAGQRWTWDGVKFEVLYPQLESYGDATIKDNNRSCVLKITSTSGSLLLTGDIEKEAESALVAQVAEQLKSDVLLAPHHGSKTSSSAEFIEAVAPGIVVFTSGYLNRFKHPVSAVVARYQALNSLMFRSDYHGAIELDFNSDSTDTGQIKAAGWRMQNKRYWHDSFN